jgi:hypothetical protein
MSDKKYESTIPVYFNQLVEKRRLDEFNDKFNDMVVLAKSKDVRPAAKGKFASDVLAVGLVNINVEDYVQKLI